MRSGLLHGTAAEHNELVDNFVLHWVIVVNVRAGRCRQQQSATRLRKVGGIFCSYNLGFRLENKGHWLSGRDTADKAGMFAVHKFR